MTVFKSQGSTFDEVYIDFEDIKGMINWGDDGWNQYLRAMYVSISRAKYKVVIYISAS
jgi:ATP-dependent exoDNAse (exonuclease V) alpha subunit